MIRDPAQKPPNELRPLAEHGYFSGLCDTLFSRTNTCETETGDAQERDIVLQDRGWFGLHPVCQRTKGGAHLKYSAILVLVL